ncbi:hypothetical protein OVY01_04605 [Robbsia sp. Bb-Pol-6]|uniref:Uncharacterized protein n=1 Tax=Robbsia betulipollinis TaxID=2981849 RepID=A0ABT3ZJ34_9BURK|nr:hypothetical protein [Robbsia betulipollinis]MCY0386528.1 hypothetical protein [Robbsia betulipollinis]
MTVRQLKYLMVGSLLIATACAHAQTTSATSGTSALDRVRIDVAAPSQSGSTPGEAAQDPFTYCYFANKSYSMGAKVNGQVCVRPKDEPGVVSSAPPPLKWVSAAQFAHGNY